MMATFGRLTDLVENGLALKRSRLFFYVFSQSRTQDFIIELNTQDQLYDEGVDATSTKLESIGGGYAASTIKRKRSKGQPTDRVTLKDTGVFYSTVEVDVQDDAFTIEAYYLKQGQDLRKRWGNNLAGLTADSRATLIQFILPEIRLFLLNYLLK